MAFNREHPERMNVKIHTLMIFMVEWGWQWGGGGWLGFGWFGIGWGSCGGGLRVLGDPGW